MSSPLASSTVAADETMECGTSLAEDAWSVPSIAAAAASSPPPENAYGGVGGADRNNSPSSSSSSSEEARARIRELRSRLAADVVSDPSPPSSDDVNPRRNFPTFVSPYERPRSKDKSSAQQPRHGSYRGMSIPLIYCDQTASQRPAKSIEDYLRRVSMPCHANTHTNITYTGSQSTAFVAEARQIVAESCNARITGKAAIDTVIFGGNGVTGVVGILVDALNLRGAVAAATSGGGGSDKRPVVFVGPHEHHSNLLPWRESGCEVVPIPERASDGMADLDHLERMLRLPRYGASSGRLRMGAFSAVSNVTGIIADVDAIAILLHRHGALAFFDYASGAPYVRMNMNPNPAKFGTTGDDDGEVDVDPSKDAIYFSPHKCYGGTSTPGVLVIKKHLISQTNPPAISGGGTVFYVTNRSHRFLSNRIERYEGGTPDGIGMQRIGLALLAGRRVGEEYEQIVRRSNTSKKGDVGMDEGYNSLPGTLLEYECSTYDWALGELKKHAPNLIVLGSCNDNNDNGNNEGVNNWNGNPSSCIGRHLPILSFLIRCGPRFLHYNYVCAVLNDVFGIQSRGGCQCAGPYSQRLLGLTAMVNSEEGPMEVPNLTNERIERALLRSDRPCELLRPGYTRLSLPFKGLREEEVGYVVQALIWVSKNGWMLLPQYRCDHRTGEWRHWSRRGKPLGRTERRWLSRFDILAAQRLPMFDGKGGNGGQVPSPSSFKADETKASQVHLDRAMENAGSILEAAKRDPRFLSEVERMNSANGMLGDGGDKVDGDGGGADDSLEQLRWYVYQQEVSQYLRDGMEKVPYTFVDDALLGGLYVRMDGKRRNPDDAGGRAAKGASGGKDDSAATSRVKDARMSNDAKYRSIRFREGDHHAGEAPYEEIKIGYEDGELTDACEVFSEARDGWISIEEFMKEYENTAVEDTTTTSEGESSCSKKRDLSAMEEDSSSSYCDQIDSMKIDNSSLSAPLDTSMGASPSQPQPLHTKHTTDLAPVPSAVKKREKKKPSRDSSQWGQCAAPHVALSNSAHMIGSGSRSPVAAPISIVENTDSAEGAKAADSNVKKATIATSSEEGAVAEVPQSPPPLAADKKMSNKSKKNKGRVKPPPKMMRYITQAMIQWEMIEEGDRLLLGLSGGKDSLSLLHCLLEYQRKLPIKFEIEICTIDPMTPSFDPSPLIPYVEGLGLKYHYIRDDIVDRANTAGKDGKTVSSLCAFCARMKRGNLYTCARKNNCNKLVLAQHLDDCAESFLMSVMHNGFIRTMKANYQINAGDVSVIRPLVYCRESLMTEFAKSANLPVINENCPACFEEPKERARIKKLLSREETLYPNLYDHIRRALIPVMHDDSTSIMRSYLEDTIAKSRKVPKAKKSKFTNCSNGTGMKGPATFTVSEDCNEASMQNSPTSLESATEEELIAELARRRARKYTLSGAMKCLSNSNGETADGNLPPDATGQICSLTGGDGMIPCTELME